VVWLAASDGAADGSQHLALVLRMVLPRQVIPKVLFLGTGIFETSICLLKMRYFGCLGSLVIPDSYN
jgi:hypothetical protein